MICFREGGAETPVDPNIPGRDKVNRIEHGEPLFAADFFQSARVRMTGRQ